jgi:hypothetical protein
MTSSATLICAKFRDDSSSQRCLFVGGISADPIVVIDKRLGDNLRSATAGKQAFASARSFMVSHADAPRRDRYKRAHTNDHDNNTDAAATEALNETTTAQPEPLEQPAAPAQVEQPVLPQANSHTDADNIVADTDGGFTTVASRRSPSPSTPRAADTAVSAKRSRTGAGGDDMDEGAPTVANRFAPLADQQELDDVITIAAPARH